MFLSLFDSIFKVLSVPIMIIGLLICAYYLTVMFDDKGKYDGSGRGFIKWLSDASVKSADKSLSDSFNKSDKEE